jgi:hypothetical protein
MLLSTLIGLLLAWALLVTGVVRVLRIARHADRLAQDLWQELARMHSDRGMAFFPTIEARRDLETSIADAIALERRAA